MKKLLFTLSILLGLNTGTLTAGLTQTQLNATLGIVTNFILDDGITFRGKNYNTVTSPYTGRVWLDRNLGADRVCTSMDDLQCFGDYYQWGRARDGHQESNSSVTSTLATDVGSVGHGDLIATPISPYDWASIDTSGTVRAAHWAKSDGSSVCPAGFRVPTIVEVENELSIAGSAQITDESDAFNTFLKLPASGTRWGYTGLLQIGNVGGIWTLSLYDTKSHSFEWSNGQMTSLRGTAYPIRCIKASVSVDISPPSIWMFGNSDDLVLLNATYNDPGWFALDDNGTPSLFTQGSVDTTQVGTYVITYIAVDGALNGSVLKRFVTVTTEILTHNGFSYGVVTSPYTNIRWLDRNLGASRICRSLDDSDCFGDYYQWGRSADGHEKKDSFTTASLATGVSSVGHSSFITNNTSPYDWTSVDAIGVTRSINWFAVDGSSVCPTGYRVPTVQEFRDELFTTGSAEVQDNTDVYASFLKLPSAGIRQGTNGLMTGQNSLGEFWTVTIGSIGGTYDSKKVYFDTSGVGDGGDFRRIKGLSIRCIKGN